MANAAPTLSETASKINIRMLLHPIIILFISRILVIYFLYYILYSVDNLCDYWGGLDNPTHSPTL